MSKERLNKYDTLKGILILLVLLGHIIGAQGGGLFSRFAVFLTYAFHMPLFMTITGRFAKFKPLDAAFYTILFFVFDAWFVVATALYYCMIPLFARIKSKKWQLLLIGGLIVLGCISGYFPLGENNPVIARLITFLPYFLLGYYRVFEWKPLKHKVLIGIFLFVFSTIFLPPICKYVLVPLFMCDQYGRHFLWQRLMSYGLGMLWTWWLLTVTTNKKVPVFTKLGKYTLWIYLLHEPMIMLVVSLLNMWHNAIGKTLFSTQLGVSIVWCLLLWPVAILLQKGTQWLMTKWRPLNERLQKACLPKTKDE